jgi:hypothetical protein
MMAILPANIPSIMDPFSRIPLSLLLLRMDSLNSSEVRFKYPLYSDVLVCVNYLQVTGSVQQFDTLASGGYDAISTAADNVANRIVNSGLSLSMIAAIELGSDFVLVGNAANGINSLSDFAGKALAVDAPDSGFVLGLREMLQVHAGLTYPQNYTFQIVGGLAERFSVLEAGRWLNPATGEYEPVYGAIITAPFTSKLYGPAKILARLSDDIAPFQNTIIAINTTSAHPDALVAFLKGYIRGIRYVYASVSDCDNNGMADNPALYNQLIPQLAVTYNTTNEIAAAILKAYTNCISGQNRNLEMNNLGLVNMILLRQMYDGFGTHQVNPFQFVQFSRGGFNDNTYYERAIRELGHPRCGHY